MALCAETLSKDIVETIDCLKTKKEHFYKNTENFNFIFKKNTFFPIYTIFYCPRVFKTQKNAASVITDAA